MTQYLHEECQGRGTIKPNENNPVTQARLKTDRMVVRMAKNMDTDTANAGLEIVKQRIPDLQRYVVEKGEQPANDPLSLSIQAMNLRVLDEKKVAETLGVSMQDASTFIDEAESRAIDTGGGADSFIGDIIGVVSNVAGKAIDRAKVNRQKKGKKTGFLDIVGSALGASGSTKEKTTFGQDVSVGANTVLDAIKDAEKKKEIKKMMPLIIIGVIVLILITVLITKNAKH